MPSTGAQRTITLALDRRIALEALVLNRLAKTPIDRRGDWLRGLVVSGFQRECETLKRAQGEHVPPMTGDKRIASQPRLMRSAYAQGLAAGRFTTQKPKTHNFSSETNQPLTQKGRAEMTIKPFAALRKVIG